MTWQAQYGSIALIEVMVNVRIVRAPLGIWTNFRANYAHGNTHYVEIPRSGDRPKYIAFTIYYE